MVRPKKITITDVLMEYYSEYNWGVLGRNYSDIVWKSDESNKPTEEEINVKIKELQSAEPLRFLREKRNIILKESDWRATIDYPGTDQEAWLIYRQALRDLPSTQTPELDEDGNLTNIIWPEKPE